MNRFLLTLVLFSVYAYSQYDEQAALLAFHYEKPSYCAFNTIQNWDCGSDCEYFPNMVSVSVFQNSSHAAQGFTGYDQARGNIVVAFRGSSNIKNWIANIDAFHIDYTGCSGCTVHKGFWNVYSDIQSEIIQAALSLATQYPSAPVLVTGHSLGGALATFAVLDLLNNLQNSVSLFVTFGCPRVGNAAFANFFNQAVPQSYRVVHFKDIVPHLPTKAMNFHHVATEVWYVEDFSSYQVCDGTGEDPNCSDSVIIPSISDHTQYFNMYTGCDDGSEFNEQLQDENYYVESSDRRIRRRF